VCTIIYKVVVQGGSQVAYKSFDWVITFIRKENMQAAKGDRQSSNKARISQSSEIAIAISTISLSHTWQTTVYLLATVITWSSIESILYYVITAILSSPVQITPVPASHVMSKVWICFVGQPKIWLGSQRAELYQQLSLLGEYYSNFVKKPVSLK
jgi:hypothetical protein